MKASFKFIIATLVATAALAGCTKEITPPNFEKDKVNPAAEGSRVIAVSFAPQTKTYLDKDGFQPKFNDEDSILISNGEALDTCAVEGSGDNATISTDLTGPLKAVYPYKAAKMNDGNPNQIDTVLVSTVQSGKFADANICMARMKGENDESLSFENKTAVFCIYPPTDNPEYVEVSAKNSNIANSVLTGSEFKNYDKIHVATTTADSVWVSILVPSSLKVGDLTFSDGISVKAITTGATADKEIAAGTLYTVTKENWKSPEADIPVGALKGVFTVNAKGKKVHFSKGNLYFDGKIWGFEEEQYFFRTFMGNGKCDKAGYNKTAGTPNDHWGLFGWSASSKNFGKNISQSINDYQGTFVDWGYAIDNKGTWTTLSGGPNGEWQYLFEHHVNVWGICKNVPGRFIAPDGFIGDKSTLSAASNNWEIAQAAGIVFLPAAGNRVSGKVGEVGDNGFYWSSSPCSGSLVFDVNFNSSNLLYPANSDERFLGCSVRLVTESK